MVFLVVFLFLADIPIKVLMGLLEEDGMSYWLFSVFLFYDDLSWEFLSLFRIRGMELAGMKIGFREVLAFQFSFESNWSS